jgi:hypothetical protein
LVGQESIGAQNKFETTPAQVENMCAMVKEKMATMKMEIMQESGMKMEESSKHRILLALPVKLYDRK